MKNRIFAMLFAGIFLLLTGCESQPQYSNENTYVAGQDFQYQFYKAIGTNMGPSSIAESEDGYYFITDSGFLYYASKDTMEAVVLCNRPDCLHNQETDEEKRQECNAYFSGSGTLFFTDGSLYIPYDKSGYNPSDASTASGQLAKVSADGTSRETIFDLYSEKCLRFHRGNLYYLDSPNEEEGGEGNMALFRRALKKDSKPEQLARFQTAEAPEITLYGNNAYVWLNTSILRVDLTNGKENTIVESSGDGWCMLIGFHQDKLVYKLADNGESHYYLSQLDGSDAAVLSEMDRRNFLQADDQYFYDIDVDFWSPNAKPEEERSVRVLQEDGTLVSEFPIGEDGSLLSMAPDDYIFKVKMDEEDAWQVDCAKKSGIETGQIEWKTVLYEKMHRNGIIGKELCASIEK